MRILTALALVLMSLGLMGDKCPDEKQAADAAIDAEEPKAAVEIVKVTDGGEAVTEPATKPTEPLKAEVKVGPITTKEVIPASEVKTEEAKKEEPKKDEKVKKEEKTK